MVLSSTLLEHLKVYPEHFWHSFVHTSRRGLVNTKQWNNAMNFLWMIQILHHPWANMAQKKKKDYWEKVQTMPKMKGFLFSNGGPRRRNLSAYSVFIILCRKSLDCYFRLGTLCCLCQWYLIDDSSKFGSRDRCTFTNLNDKNLIFIFTWRFNQKSIILIPELEMILNALKKYILIFWKRNKMKIQNNFNNFLSSLSHIIKLYYKSFFIKFLLFYDQF